ncbi:hypothetical protein KSP40_PGU011184 [Platanthera guangdongensis]|uniref:Uncharacterized protein n=1 Tax=Platanthera guangdongensis TaxID=2320717 RepID=A0ABR2LNQ9_9ASPA
MAWFFGDRRGRQYWKQGWRVRALDSLSLPPAPLVAVLTIVLLFLSLSSRAGYKARVERVEVGLQLLLLLVPLLLVFAVKLLVVDGRVVFPRVRRTEQDERHVGVGSPWGVAAAVVLLLFMVSFHYSVESQWFRPLWRRVRTVSATE